TEETETPGPEDTETPEPEETEAPEKSPEPEEAEPAETPEVQKTETPEPEETETPEESLEPRETEAPEETPEPEETKTPEESPDPDEAEPAGETPQPRETETPEPERTAPPATPEPEPDILDYLIEGVYVHTPTPAPTPKPTPTPEPAPTPTPDRTIRKNNVPSYDALEKIELDESKILPELREIYEMNHDFVGWISIEGTEIDYPVVQTEDNEYYLYRDFNGNRNYNGQIILDAKCDPYTPSYNLNLSGHHMNSGKMFGRLLRYKDRKYWEEHKIVEFDSLMQRRQYVIFAVFMSADYNKNEKGFRYNADIRYRMDAEEWLAEIEKSRMYDTGYTAKFGDEFLTLSTCDRSRRRSGRFVVVARKIREGEMIQ
ncbi:MAG: class B sortase, partial [Clostridia bacterium]|nr:class B sortase [Clostridia bacterium]